MKDVQEQQRIPDAYRVFVLISITNLLVSLDHGIIPAASVQIQSALKLSNQELGVLGSLVYAGTVVMGFVASFIFLKYNPLRVIEISMITMILSLFVFTLQFDIAWPYYLSRFITGAAQAPLIVYFPVWVDTFGLDNKTVWLTILQGGVPFGVFVGYVLASVIAAQWNWRWAFYLQIAVLVLQIREQYNYNKEMNQIIPSIILLSRQPHQNIDVRPYVKDHNNTYEKMPYFELVKLTLKSRSYVVMTIVLGLLYFSVTGIQFWISNYLVNVLCFNQGLVNTLFSLDSITGPTLGCVLGGLVTQHYGGYDSKNAYYITSIAAVLGSLSSICVTLTTNLWAITGFIWLLLFFGGALVPIMTGIVLSSVNQGMRSFANSNILDFRIYQKFKQIFKLVLYTTTYVNLFGYLPAPIIYGYLSSISPNLGYYCLMYCPSVGCLMILWTTYHERRKDYFVADKSMDSLEMHPPSARSTSVMQIIQNFHNQSDDFVKEVLEFHSTPINNITTNLYYEKQL